MNKWDYIKLSSFFLHSKRNHQQNEKATYGMGTPFSKGLIANIYKELVLLGSKQAIRFKKAEDLNRYFSREDVQWPIDRR